MEGNCKTRLVEDGMSTLHHILVYGGSNSILRKSLLLLEASNAVVQYCEDESCFRAAISDCRPTVIILFGDSTGCSGRSLVKALHNRGDLIPFVAAVEHHDPLEAAVCLSEGADDYISTATEVIELVARIQSVIKRATAKQVSAKERVMTLGSLCLDQVQRRVFVASQEVSITPKAFALLRHFMLHPNKIFSREQLLDAIWGWDKEFNDRVVDVRVWELRKLLSSDSSGINYIETVVGVGYRFVSDRDDVST